MCQNWAFLVISMEIDLNCSIIEEGIEESNNEKDSSSSISSSCTKSSISLSSSINMELWHACTGPLSTLPKRGNVVVYFTQGHLEQVGFSSPFPPMELPKFDLQPQIFCRVMDVQFLANKENDEVYTQLSLLPLTEVEIRNLEGKKNGDSGSDEEDIIPCKTPQMFCKTLTASDTSTHGGFSVPRRAAEDCFPRLDYKLQRPSQELIAKDLHGDEWRFRHIYRGQPRRHLLTTGWSLFVSQKRLVSGDAVLFLRDENGVLRLGIRRAIRPRNGLPNSIISNQNYLNIISISASAVSSKSTFSIFYSPRATHADFVVPYQKYIKSVSNLIPKGTRFRMKFNVDDSPERSGVVTGICDLDPYRWPHSKWRCLRVRWDDDMANNHQEQVSPWEIDHSVSLPPLSIIHSSLKLKKLRAGPQAAPPDHLAPGFGFSDYEGSFRSSKVLQGQENISRFSPLIGFDKVNRSLDFGVQCNFPHHQNFAPNGLFPKNNPTVTTTYTGFGGPTQSPKVLQGQEICSLRSFTEKPNFALGAWDKPDLGPNMFSMYQGHNSNFYPLASEGVRNLSFPYVKSYPRENVPSTGTKRAFGGIDGNLNVPKDFSGKIAAKGIDFGSKKGDGANANVDEHKIFGFSLPVDSSGSNPQNGNKRSCTKVHKQGSSVGRAIDLSRLNSYNDLLIELERLFNMEGVLLDPKKGWQILYTDSENDMMVVGDDPWNEFCNVVSKIHIYTREEVQKMTIGVGSDATHSSLEEASAPADVSKSSSVGQPDSPPTVLWM